MPVAQSSHGEATAVDDDDGPGSDDRFFGRGRPVELEDMKQVSRDVYQWRSGTRAESGLRLRNAAGPSRLNAVDSLNRSPLDEASQRTRFLCSIAEINLSVI